jgi:hypothetical protein
MQCVELAGAAGQRLGGARQLHTLHLTPATKPPVNPLLLPVYTIKNYFAKSIGQIHSITFKPIVVLFRKYKFAKCYSNKKRLR